MFDDTLITSLRLLGICVGFACLFFSLITFDDESQVGKKRKSTNGFIASENLNTGKGRKKVVELTCCFKTTKV
jgi:hypothetical protein